MMHFPLPASVVLSMDNAIHRITALRSVLLANSFYCRVFINVSEEEHFPPFE